MFAELPHKGNAELPDLIVGFALGIEVGSTFTSANVYYTTNQLQHPSCLTLEQKNDDVRPVRAFLKICSKPKNLRMERLTVGWNLSPPLYGPKAELNCTR